MTDRIAEAARATRVGYRSNEYWEEAVFCALDAAGVTATDEQVAAIARDIEEAHECYGMAFYTPANPVVAELKQVTRLLEEEKSKVVCPDCKGEGRTITHGPYHSCESSCFRCRGEGKIKG